MLQWSGSSTVSTTRPNDTTAYTAGDCIGSSTSSGGAIWQFDGIGPQMGGGQVMITTVQLEIDVSAVPSGMTYFTLYLYSGSPPSAYADNAAWDLPSGDRSVFRGSINLGTPVDLGSTLYVETTQVNKQIGVPAGGSGTLYAYLVTAAGYTPNASAVYKITLHAVGL